MLNRQPGQLANSHRVTSTLLYTGATKRCDKQQTKLPPVSLELTTSGFLTPGVCQGRPIVCYETDALTNCANGAAEQVPMFAI